MDKLLKDHLDLLLDPKEKAKYAGIWNKHRKNKDEGVQNFLKEAQWNEDLTEFILREKNQLNSFKAILMGLIIGTDQELKEKINEYKNIIGQKAINNMGSNQADLSRIPSSADYDQIEGNKLLVEVIYNPDQINIQYSYKKLQFQAKLKESLKQFAFQYISFCECRINEKKQTVRIFEDKRYKQDKYAPAYVFDPFMGAVKFLLRKKEGTFKKSFRVLNSDGMEYKLLSNNSVKLWISDNAFTSKDPVRKLVDYICKKENADTEAAEEFLNNLRTQHIKTIEDILKFKDMKQLTEKILRKKWAIELQIEIEKIRSPPVQTSFQQFRDNSQKLKCLKQAYSHKILRYLFFKLNDNGNGQGLRALKEKIPLLNPRIVDTAIELVRKELTMPGLFDQLSAQFIPFTMLPSKEKATKETPTGMMFYGPPGTGKTCLTEQLPELMGYHLVSNGLSATAFMKQLVGEAKGMVESYLSRALLSPHLACSLAIDQIQSIVQRRNSQNKSSSETLSKFLSMLGGNEAVPNILLLSSTNMKLQVDPAFIRRSIPIIYVGLPSKEERRNILIYYFSATKQYIDFLTSITPNFTGAALKALTKSMVGALELKRRRNQADIFTESQLLMLAHKAALNLNIKFGDSTFQQLCQSNQYSKEINLSLLKKFKHQTIILTSDQKQVTMHFGLEKDYFDGQQIKQCYQYCQSYVPISCPLDDKRLVRWLGALFNPETAQTEAEFQTIVKQVRKNAFEDPIVLFFNFSKTDQLKNLLKKVQSCKNIFYCFFSNTCNQLENIQGIVKQQLNLQSKPSNYTGRALVDLNAGFPSRMELERNEDQENEQKVELKPFIQSKKAKSLKKVLPQVVNFLADKNLGIIQVIDSAFFTNRAAYNEQQCMEVLKDLIEETNQYKYAGLIIDMDSLIMVSKSYSNSSTGDNFSFAINKPTMYQQLLNILKNFNQIQKDTQKWMVALVEEQQLSKMVKRDMVWPPNASQKKEVFDARKQQEQKELEGKTRTCRYCRQKYTMEENKKQRGCPAHYGQFIHLIKLQIQEKLSIQQARFIEFSFNRSQEKETKVLAYTCCWGYIGSDPCEKFHHFSGSSDEIDEVTQMMLETYDERLQRCIRLNNTQIQSLSSANTFNNRDRRKQNG